MHLYIDKYINKTLDSFYQIPAAALSHGGEHIHLLQKS